MYESRLTLKKNIDWKDTDRSFENYFDLVVKLRFQRDIENKLHVNYSTAEKINC